jgi:hypothetical protein
MVWRLCVNQTANISPDILAKSGIVNQITVIVGNVG